MGSYCQYFFCAYLFTHQAGGLGSAVSSSREGSGWTANRECILKALSTLATIVRNGELFQRMSVALQRGNAEVSTTALSPPSKRRCGLTCLLSNILYPRKFSTEGLKTKQKTNRVETLGVFNASARHLLSDLGRRISLNSGEARETSFLYQRISILVQRFNAVLLHDSLPAVDSTD